jgi:Tol biopolymer transport system component
MKTILSLFVAFLTVIAVSSAFAQSAEDLFQKGIQLEEVKGQLEKAIDLYKSIVEKNATNKPVTAKALLHLGNCYEKLGKSEAKKAYDRIVREFADQQGVAAEARTRLAVLAQNGSRQKEKPSPTVRRVAEFGAESLSRDGRYVTYRDYNSNRNGDIAVRDLTTGETRRLMKDENPSSLRISPDGKQIAYSRALTDDFSELRIMNIDGSEPRVLYRNEEVRSYDVTDWSSDGKYILTVFKRKGGGIQIALVPTSKDGSLHLLKTLTWNYPNKMSLSPDGHWIAYDLPPRTDVSQRDIYLLASDGSRETHLIDHPANDQTPFWTPDGKRILFSSDRRGTPGLWSIAVADGKPQGSPELIKEDLKFYPVGITSTGALYYSLRIEGNDVYTADIDSISGELLSSPKLATERFLGSNTNPEWSPDGKYLAYLSPRNLRDLVVVQTMSTGEEREFHSLRRIGYELKWSPDGRSLLASAYDSKGRRGIHKIDVQTGVGTSLVPNVNTSNYGIISIGWFPHDNSIFYVTPEKENRLIRKNLDTGEEQELFKFTQNLYYVAISPDGKQFAFYQVDDKANTRSILIVPASGGKPRELLKIKQEDNLTAPPTGITWTPDGHYLIFGRTSESGEKIDLWRISVEGGDPEKLGSLMSGVHELSVHPDGKRIAFSVRQGKEELWVMENFLPKEDLSVKYTTPLIRQVWADHDGVALTGGVFGAPSPDGRYLSYVDFRTGCLAIRDLATGEKRGPLNNKNCGYSEGLALFTSFSPDSKQIAYDWMSEKDGIWELDIIGVDSSNPRVLYRNEEVPWIQPTAWSPDGKNILAVFGKKDRTNQIALVSVIDGSVRVLKTLDWRYPGLRTFSPDGRYIAYDLPQQQGSQNRDIFLLSTDGSRETRLLEHAAKDFVLGWTPDGTKLLFASDRRGTVDAWAIRVIDGKAQGEPEMIKSNLGQIEPMGFTRKGSYYYGVQTGVRDLYTATLDAEMGKLLIPPAPAAQRFLGTNKYSDWSPDGQHLAYISDRKFFPLGGPPNSIIAIRSLKTGEVRELSPKLNYIGRVRWFPDGQSLLVRGSDERNRTGLFRIDARTGEVSTIFFHDDAQESILSADGKSVFFTTFATPDNTPGTFERNLETGEEKELYRGLGRYMTLSPDGRQLAFATADSADKGLTVLAVIPTTGGKPRQLYTVAESGEYISTVARTADGRFLIFGVQPNTGDKTELWRIPAEGGEPQRLGFSMDQLRSLRINPDGQHIAFDAGIAKGEVWVMENFLPKEEPEKNLTVRRVEDGNGQLISPDGRYRLVRDKSTGALAIQDLTTGENRRFRKDETIGWPSQISPDGKQIAYQAFDFFEGKTTGLNVISADGSEHRVLYRNEEIQTYSVDAWSPDGKYILTTFAGKGGVQIALVPTSKDGSVHILKTLPWVYPLKMSFSPDGRWIAYDLPPSLDVQQRDIFLLASDGSRETHLIENPANDGYPLWTRDGKRILFVSDRRGTSGLWSIAVTDGKPQAFPELLKPDVGQMNPVGITAEGTLYYQFGVNANDIYTAEIDSISGKLLSSPKLAAERFVGFNSKPEWSPDGQYLTYVSRRGTTPTSATVVVIHSVKTGEDRELGSVLGIGFELKWSPDGHALLVSARDSKGRRGINKVDVQTGAATLVVANVTTMGGGFSSVGWFPQDKSIFYISPLRENRLIRTNLESGEEQDIFKFAKPTRYLTISPDGKQFACWRADSGAAGLVLLPAKGGNPRELFKIMEDNSSYLSGLAWTPDGRYLMFTKKSGSEEEIGLWRISVEGGDPQRLGSLMDGVDELSVHPDGKRIAFSVRQSKRELWTMENFLSRSLDSAR